MLNVLIFVLVLLGAIQATDSFTPAASLQRKTSVALHLSSTVGGGPFLYRDEPHMIEREEIKKEQGKKKHSMYHIEHGPETYEKADPVHSLHHHLIDVDHDKLNDLGVRAQHAWTPVNVHEMEVDAFTLSAVLFGVLALILFSVQQ